MKSKKMLLPYTLFIFQGTYEFTAGLDPRLGQTQKT